MTGAAARVPTGTLRLWLLAIRPRTLPASIAPVLVGTALAVHDGVFQPLRFAAALAGSILIQIGTNLANDYSDARRGADREDRLGPVRVTAGGLMPPRRVLAGAWVAFAAAVGCGLYLTAVAGIWVLVIGVASILAGVLYTGGPRPYGYAGLGELFVFVFFGLVAVGGSYYVQTERLSTASLLLAVPVGLLAAAILVVNNVRDLESDRRAGKITLAVRLGRRHTRRLYMACVATALVLPGVYVAAGELPPPTLASLLAAPLAPAPLRAVASATDGPTLNQALAATGRLLAVHSALLAVGLLVA
ncbi:1,4-dihydroxy-2-naphthoate octaprenyltransferase [bacterium HR41]|nr:1,4-dihydroxy-2-naphthoate polyprenyltransferase [Thermoleophilum sp.]GBD46014.1 1,4-dihydroxy-2-naphthoate octaprenyltransferase [bacterium HR41]